MQGRSTYARSEARFETKAGFYNHLAVYLAVNILLVIINLTGSPEFLWFVYPLLGWGIGLFLHALRVFFLQRFRV